MKKRIGIIGLGDITQKAYLPVFAASEQTEIVGIMSRTEATAERIGEQYRIPARFTDLKKLLACEPEAVFVHTPTETHASIVLECLKQGVHVYVDKPLSYDIRESADMVEAAERSGKLLAVGFNRRFAPFYITAKQWLAENGGFHLCSAEKHRTRKQRHSAEHTLYDDLIHMIDLLVWLGGPGCAAESFRMAVDPDGRMRYSSGTLALPDGTASFAMERSAGCDLERLELHGEGRSAQVLNLEQAVLWDKTAGKKELHFGSWESIAVRRGFHGVIEHFLESFDHPAACTIRADQVWETHQLVEQLANWQK